MTEYDAKMVAADIVTLLREHWRSLPNDRTESLVTSYRQNACGDGLREAIIMIAATYGLDISDPNAVQIRPSVPPFGGSAR